MTTNILCTDLDGPIINCEDRYYAVYKDNVLELGGNPIAKSDYWEQKRNRVNEKYLLKLSNVEEKYYNEYHQMKIAKIEDEYYLDKDVLQLGFHEIMSDVRKRFHKVILITLRRNKRALETQLQKLNINGYFDYILSGFSEDVPAWKVKADLFFSTFANDGVHTDITGYFVGDTEVDILAGKEIGLKTVAVSSGIRTKETLQSYNPDIIVDDLKGFLLTIDGEDLKQ